MMKQAQNSKLEAKENGNRSADTTSQRLVQQLPRYWGATACSELVGILCSDRESFLVRAFGFHCRIYLRIKIPAQKVKARNFWITNKNFDR